MDWLAQIATPLVSGAVIALMLGVGLILSAILVSSVAARMFWNGSRTGRSPLLLQGRF